MNAVSPRNSAALESELAYFPIFLGLRGRQALLIGGGEAALAKLDLLRRAGALVRQIHHCAEPLCARHFADVVLVIDASGDLEINRQSTALARAASVPINVVDRPALCDFIMPAILDRSPVIVAVSTGGMAPAIARLIRQRLETAIPAGIGQLAVVASRFRRSVAESLLSAQHRARFWERLFTHDVAELVAAGRMDDAAAFAETLIAELQREPVAASRFVLPVSSDDPDLLTVRAARLIRMADVVFYEPQIAPGIIGLARRDAPAVAVESEAHADRLGRRFAGSDRTVVYLKAAISESYDHRHSRDSLETTQDCAISSAVPAFNLMR